MLALNDIRKVFLDYFKNNDHQIVASSPLVPQNDPTLMFTNAGMVQFKNLFTGLETRNYTRAASSQKCVRAGGKHNDLDNVGYTARHHTFFEMLGNFSFGDYFKEQAIYYAWDSLTNVFGLPKDKLYITIYHDDEEAYKCWKKLTGFSDDRIIRIPTSDNFWSMGDTGPCGPCTEIFYDHGDKVWGGLPGTKDADGDRYIEIWNLVFMQFEALADGTKVKLPKPCVDTGMGLERIAAVLQGVHNNYEIDLFKNIINESAALTKTSKEGEDLISHRVIADHLRSTSFLIADGVMPSNEGRGYVLRRIMRRAMRHAYNLGSKAPLMHQLVNALVREMGGAYPELIRAQSLIEDVLKMEEERFGETLGRGIKLLNTELEGKTSGYCLPGTTAFKLYDTYGFPIDLTIDILRKQQIDVDTNGFDQAMKEQKEKARQASKGSGDKLISEIWFNIYSKVGATEFLGYENVESQAEILALIANDQEVQTISDQQEIWVICNQSPFYGESGGQVGDTGTMIADDGAILEVIDTKKYFGSMIVHKAKLLKGTIKTGSKFTLKIHHDHRTALRANHSATHLLHAVMKDILGEHVVQKGSMVAPDRLRFDFSHNKSVSKEEIDKIEDAVNKLILANTKTKTRIMPLEQAMTSGAQALFGEKYEEEVRVVSMGGSDEKSYSVELCGGTHVHATGDIGLFKVTSEFAVAAGIRRIEALTGMEALNYIRKEEEVLSHLSDMLKVKSAEIAERVTQLMNDKRNLEKEIGNLKKKSFALVDGDIKQHGATKYVAKLLDNIDSKDLRDLAQDFQNKLGSGIIALVSKNDDKAQAIVSISQDLATQFNAVDIIQKMVEQLGGQKGGGKPNLAQGGGNKPENAAGLVENFVNILE